MLKVLLVEDNEFNRDMLSRRLARAGCNVVPAVDGTQGLACAMSGDWDVILMDMSIPGIDGWHLAQMLKENERTCGIPIIALTAHAMNGDRERALESGCDEFEAKPIQFANLLAKMAALCTKAERCA